MRPRRPLRAPRTDEIVTQIPFIVLPPTHRDACTGLSPNQRTVNHLHSVAKHAKTDCSQPCSAKTSYCSPSFAGPPTRVQEPRRAYCLADVRMPLSPRSMESSIKSRAIPVCARAWRERHGHGESGCPHRAVAGTGWGKTDARSAEGGSLNEGDGAHSPARGVACKADRCVPNASCRSFS